MYSPELFAEINEYLRGDHRNDTEFGRKLIAKYNLPVKDRAMRSLIHGQRFALSSITVIPATTTAQPTTPLSTPEVKEDTLLDDLKVRRLSAEAKLWKKKYERALGEVETLSDALDAAALIREDVVVKPYGLDERSNTLGNAVPIVQYSDWHCAERVVASTIDGLNEFNPDICRRRVFTLSQNTLRVVNNARQNSTIDELVLILGGDFQNNFLHSHDTRNNYLSPIEEIRFAKELLINSITFLVEFGKFKRIRIGCTRGNHSRQTEKMSASDDFRMNYEQLLYCDLKEYFDRRTTLIEWDIPTGSRGYLQVYEKTLRYLHGWEIKGRVVLAVLPYR